MNRAHLFPLLGLILCLSGCAQTQPDTVPVPHSKTCTEAWIYAPARYILDLASSSEILINPAVQDFPIYCSTKDAADALDLAIQKRERPEGNWAFFRLAGEYNHLVRYEGDRALLREMTQIVDWEERKKDGSSQKTVRSSSDQQAKP